MERFDNTPVMSNFLPLRKPEWIDIFISPIIQIGVDFRTDWEDFDWDSSGPAYTEILQPIKIDKA